MSEESAFAAKRPSLKLPNVLDIAAAADLKRELLEVLAAGGCVNVDASAVQRITTPCLQIMASAAKSFAQSGGSRLRLHSVPQILAETIAMLGLSEALSAGDISR